MKITPSDPTACEPEGAESRLRYWAYQFEGKRLSRLDRALISKRMAQAADEIAELKRLLKADR